MCELKSYWYFHGCLLRFPSLSAAKSYIRTIVPEHLNILTLMDPWIYHSVNGEVVGRVLIRWWNKGEYTFGRPKHI